LRPPAPSKGDHSSGGIKAYTEVISGAIGQALSLVPPDGSVPVQSRRGRRGLILFCAEQGFAGAFSERVLDAVMSDLAGSTVFLVGTRGVAVAEERDIHPAWSAPMATHAGAIPTLPTGLLTSSTSVSQTEPSLGSTWLFHVRTLGTAFKSTGMPCFPSI
jgi:hypothetical protein